MYGQLIVIDLSCRKKSWRLDFTQNTILSGTKNKDVVLLLCIDFSMTATPTRTVDLEHKAMAFLWF